MKLLIQGIILSLTFIAAYAACGGYFTELSGEFTSPGYPRKYPNKKQCLYTFDTGYPITLTCSRFKLQKANRRGRCTADFFKISDSRTSYCGNAGPVNYISTSNVVKVFFRSNKKIRKPGFSCTYESIIDETTSTTTTSTTMPTTTSTTTTSITTPTTTSSTTTPTTMPTTTSTSTSTTTTPIPDMLQTALQLFNNGICYTGRKWLCGCTTATQDDSKFYMTTSGNYRIVAANGIPHHQFEVGQDRPNPNRACPHEVYMAIPLNPIKGNTYRAYRMGPVGIAISGGFFYNHLSRPSGEVALVNEGISFDTCNGHSDPTCRYHYHMLPKCIAGEGTCALVGYMMDGFSVYTYCTHETESRYLKSCYYLTSGDGSMSSHYTYSQTAYDNGSCDLDQANGYTFSDERGYAYIFTEDYPFIMAGYYGTEPRNICYLER